LLRFRAIRWARGQSCGILCEMKGSPTTKGVPAVPQKRQHGRGTTVLRRSKPVQRARNRKLHAMLKRDGKPKSGRCGEYVYYMRQGRQCWRHYVVPKDPRTARQQLSRKAFSAASRMWSQDGPLTEAERDAWYADGAKRQSRRRLGQSGPLTGQQDYVGRNYAKERRRLEMLLEPRQREVKSTGSRRHNPESAPQGQQSQRVPQSTWGTRRGYAVPAPSLSRVGRGYARKASGRLMSPQVARSQRLARSTWGRPQTNTRVLPVQRQREPGHSRATGEIGVLKRSPKLRKVRRNAPRLKL
jgi:hypothetical protein